MNPFSGSPYGTRPQAPQPNMEMAGAASMNPWVMGGQQALSFLGGLGQQGLQERQFKLSREQAARMEHQDFVNAYNAQQRRDQQTETNSAFLKQLAQRLGIPEMEFAVAKEMILKPLPGTQRIDREMEKYYGIKPSHLDPNSLSYNQGPTRMKDFQRVASAATRPTGLPPGMPTAGPGVPRRSSQVLNRSLTGMG